MEKRFDDLKDSLNKRIDDLNVSLNKCIDDMWRSLRNWIIAMGIVVGVVSTMINVLIMLLK